MVQRKRSNRRLLIDEDSFLKSLLDEFPHLYTSPGTIHYLWQRHSRQIELLTKNYSQFKQQYMKRYYLSETDTTCGENKISSFLTEAYNKQKMLMELMRNDLAHYERLNDLKRQQLVQNSLKVCFELKLN